MEIKKPKTSNWTPLFSVGDNALRGKRIVTILHRAVNKSYFINDDDTLAVVEEFELKKLGV
ncbi:MAG: hypothetical protein WC900_07170 [Oscillospiraceae bacterium]|jgi:hypothetical protein